MEKRKIVLMYTDDTQSLHSLNEMSINYILGSDNREVEVDHSYSGEEMIKKVRENPSRYDGLISDFEMGEISGLEALAQLREEFPNIKSFIVTGNPSKAQESRDRGFDALDKPYTPGQLKEQLAKTFPEFYQPVTETA